ncbi:MAG: recombinase family protein [Aggregatilineales bacterium]
MSSANRPTPPQRVTALCYVRLSVTRDESDLNSPERQRANIQAECDRRGWTPEWYEDVEGHKSGTQEDNRPGWLALKNRLGDSDVVAVVANDLSRLHRKGWRVGNLLDMLEKYGIGLVLAAPGRNLDLAGPTGKITTMIMALMDEYYATDISEKQKDSVRHRRAKGVIVGGVPFGTTRNKQGFLERSTKGVWLLGDATFVEGEKDKPPEDARAIWSGFADAAQRCLELYAENRFGLRKIAQLLNMEGYRYQKRYGQIIPFRPDDIRRIEANWVEYGGAVIFGRARGRRAKDVKLETVTLNPERAVFDIDLCYRVGEVRQRRTRDIKRSSDYGVRLDATIYPLSKLIYCAHCERLAQEADDYAFRSHLTGKTGNKKESRRYRHDTQRQCPSKRRSVNADLVERDFLLLLGSLTVKPEVLPLLAEAVDHFNKQNQREDTRSLIQTEIAHWRQRAENADKLFAKARIGEEDWRATLETADHEIARLQLQTIQYHEAEVALKLTMDMVANLVENWNAASPENRRALASGLFEYLVYDLDAQQITDFKLKPWIELLMQLKVTLGDDNSTDPDTSGSNDGGKQGVLLCPQRERKRTTFWLRTG